MRARMDKIIYPSIPPKWTYDDKIRNKTFRIRRFKPDPASAKAVRRTGKTQERCVGVSGLLFTLVRTLGYAII